MRKRKMRMALAALTAITCSCSAVLGGCGKTEAEKNSGTKELTTKLVDENGNFSYPINTDETLDYWCELNPNVSVNFANLGDTPFAKEWQKQTGVSINFLHPPANQGKEQFSLMLADGELPDMVEYAWMDNYPGGPEKAIEDGNILALNDIFEKYCPNLTKYLKEHPDVDRMVKTDEGHYYVFPFIRGDETLCHTIGPMVREDWLKELGMEVPTTIDEWHDVLTAFKEEKGAEAPLTWEYTMGALTNEDPFAYAFGACRNFFLGNDGKVHFGAVEAGYKDYLATFNQWYKEGLLDSDLATLAFEQVSAKMSSGQSGAAIGWAGSSLGTWVTAGMQSNPEYMLVPAPFPTLEKGETPEMGQIDNLYPNQGGVAISTSCENVELAARLLDFAYSEEGHMLFNFGIEGESYTMENDYPTYTDKIFNNPDGWSTAQSLSAYIRGNYNGPFVQDPRYLEQYFTLDSQKAAPGVWGATNAAEYKLPPITPTADESKEFASIMNEINTYRDEMTLKFIFGTESLDKFDEYVKTIEGMGLKRVLEIQNAALERYNNR